MKNLWIAIIIAVVVPLGGCANMDQTQKVTAKGAGIGAAAGAVIGAVLGGAAQSGAKGGARGGVFPGVCGPLGLWERGFPGRSGRGGPRHAGSRPGGRHLGPRLRHPSC